MKNRRLKLRLVLWALLLLGILVSIKLRHEPTYQGQPASHWIRHLSKASVGEAEWEMAKEALREMGPESVPYLVKSLPKEPSRLSQFVETARDKLPSSVSKFLPDRDELRGCAYAIDVLEEIGSDAKKAIPTLARDFESSDDWAAYELREALVKIGGDSPIVLETFLRGLQNPTVAVRFSSARGLGCLGSKSQAVVKALTGVILNDEYDHPTWAAAQALGQIGPSAESALPVLREAMNSEESSMDVRLAAALSIWQITSETNTTVPIIIKAIEEGGGLWTPEYATDALAEIGPPASAALPLCKDIARRIELKDPTFDPTSDRIMLPTKIALAIWRIEHCPDIPVSLFSLTLKSGGDGSIIRAAIDGLREIGPEAKAAVPLLIRALGDVDYRTRAAAAAALGEIGASAGPAVPELTKALADKMVLVRLEASRSLWRIDGQTASIFPVVIEALQSRNRSTRQKAVAIFVEIGPAAREALPALEKLLSARNSSVRETAIMAIRAVTKAASN